MMWPGYKGRKGLDLIQPSLLCTCVLFTVIILLSIEDSFNSELYSLIFSYFQKDLMDFVAVYGVLKSLYHSYSLHIQCSQCV